MSLMRVSGLATGMDIEQIISDMMKVKRMPLDKLTQQKQTLEWQQEDYRSMNSLLNNLKESLFDLKLERTFNVKTAASSNEAVAQVTASGNAQAGNYVLTVLQLAEGAFKTSEETLGSKEDKNTLASQFELSGEIAFSINGKEFSVDADTESIYSLIEKINRADIGVQASYDSNLDRFFLTTTETGADAKIAISDGNDADGKSLFGDILKIDATAVQGKDALFELNGANFQMASNDFTINGVSYSLKGISPGTEGNRTSTNISVKADTEQVFQSVMDFVNLYNETMDKINTKLTEKYYRDYDPLTDDMRGELDEDQIEKWTAKAKSGLLRNDSLLSGIVNDIRNNLYSVVEGVSGKYNSFASLGITTGTYSERGKLYVDEDKLREAITADPEAVKELFTAKGQEGNAKTQGIGSRLYDKVLNGISKITERAGAESDFSLVDNSVIGKRIKDMDDRIENFETRLKIIEDRYWKQFTALEQAINQMNSQSAWLSQQLGMWSQS